MYRVYNIYTEDFRIVSYMKQWQYTFNWHMLQDIITLELYTARKGNSEKHAAKVDLFVLKQRKIYVRV